jgi:hypothetical protein
MMVRAKIRPCIFLALLALTGLCLGGSCSGPAPPEPLSGTKSSTPPPAVAFPLKPDSVRFAIIGDSGTGNASQYDIARKMASAHNQFPFDFVVMLGDNIYGGHTALDFSAKFERPYEPLLAEGVKFYASLGNHDDPASDTLYKPFNMGGQRYYAYTKGNVRFFVLDSNYMDPAQLAWLEKELHDATAPWKIAYFHHPLYSDGRFHGPDIDLRTRLEPLFQKYGVNVVLSGHEHVYERIKPQHGIYYFILGNAGELRFHNLKASPNMMAGFDEDRCFMLMEVAGDELYFQTISRAGKLVDSGVLERQPKPEEISAKPESRRALSAAGF